MSDASIARIIPPADQPTITGNMSKFAAAMYGLAAVWLTVLSVLVFNVYRTIQAGLSSQFQVLALLFCIFALYLFVGFVKVPFRTILQGSVLTTYSALGRRSIDLQNLDRISRSLLIGGRSGSVYILKLSAPRSSLFIHLGSIPRDERKQLFSALNPYILNDRVKQGKWASRTFQDWWPLDHGKVDFKS